MIAHGAKHPALQISKGHVVWKSADVQFGVVMTARIAAVDEHVGSPGEFNVESAIGGAGIRKPSQ
jgi:hypothetical protein